MAYFPRVSEELSAEASLRFLIPGTSHLRPAYIHRFEDGSRSARFRTPAGTHDFSIEFVGPEADVAVMNDFFEEHGIVVPFTVEHPTRGTMTKCYLKQQKHDFEPVVNGPTPWTRIMVPIEGAP